MSMRYSGEILELQAEYSRLGLTEANAHRPPSDASHPDQNEHALRSVAEKHLGHEQNAFEESVGEANRALIQLQTEVVRLGTEIHQALGEAGLAAAIEADKAAIASELSATVVRRKQAERDYRHFRAVHRIAEEPVYPESTLWHFGIVAVLVLVETAVNTFFFENEQGLLGGFVVAIAVSAVNMFGALFLGIGFRYRNLTGLDHRVLGWSCLVLFVFLTLYCNALFAAFRSEYQLLLDPSSGNALRDAFARADHSAREILILQSRFPDFLSFILFVIGVILSGLAFHKGYTVDDRFPGHGRRHRALVEAQGRELAAKNAFRTRVKDTFHRSRLALQGMQGMPAQLVGRVAARKGELDGARQTLVQKAAAVQRDYANVLGSYRQANLSVRVTPAPAYFNDIPDIGGKASSAHCEPILDALAEVRRDVERLQSDMARLLAEKIASVDADRSRILKEIDAEFFVEVEREAEAQINGTVFGVRASSVP